MRKILYTLTALVLFAGCNDKIDKSKPYQPKSYPIHKNAYRAVEITGHDSQWGDYKFVMFYSKEKLDSAFRYDNTGFKTGAIAAERYSTTSTFTSEYRFFDRIPAISQDSILRMDTVLMNRYGKNNYSLRDSIPYDYREQVNYTCALFEDGRIFQQEETFYKPREDVGITGVNFNNSYIKVLKYKHLYEYNDNGAVSIIRSGIYVFTDPLDDTKFTTSLLKNQIFYNGDNISSIEDWAIEAGNNYALANRYSMNYSGGKLTSVTGNGYKKTFSYVGNHLTVDDNGVITKYEYDDNGNVTRIEKPGGNYIEIKYEPGHGDLSIFTPLLQRAMGTPYIK